MTPLGSNFQFEETTIAGLVLVQRNRHEDARGYLSRLYCSELLKSIGFCSPIMQINQTHTLTRGSIRGMHFQRSPYAEDKFVSCLKGEIFDVAIDLRAGSPTFLCWHSAILSSANAKSLYIPAGFAHGFQTLSDDCELLYFHTQSYHRESEDGLNALDPRLEIDWPLPVSDISPRDQAHPMLTREFTGLTP